MNPLIELGSAPHQNLEAHGRRNVGDFGEPEAVIGRQPADGGHDLRAVDQGEPFPCFEPHGVEAASPQGRLPLHALPLEESFPESYQHEAEMSEGNQVAARSHRSLLRHKGDNIPVQQVNETFGDFKADA